MSRNETYKTIGLWGLTFNSGNLGCSALSISFLNILKKINTKKYNIYIFYQGEDFNTNHLSSTNFEVYTIPFNLRSISSIRKLIHYIKECDISFDFTAGDSFSDIYGLKRFFKTCLLKKLAQKNSAKFVLGPQTYGPFDNKIAQYIAKKIIEKTNYTCSRDTTSAEYLKRLYKINIDVFTDVAFALPYQNNHILESSDNKRKIGINVSGLLWNGGYTKNNQFGLKVDYCSYITELIQQLLKTDNTDIYLIPHVISSSGANPECDYNVSEMLIKQFPSLKLAPKFHSPIEAKNFISEMDIFTGARMHATIGAFSSGVTTIPFSYSRKFEGLYNSIGYPYTINAQKLDTPTAIKQTLEFINKSDILRSSQTAAYSIIQSKLSLFEAKTAQLIEE